MSIDNMKNKNNWNNTLSWYCAVLPDGRCVISREWEMIFSYRVALEAARFTTHCLKEFVKVVNVKDMKKGL